MLEIRDLQKRYNSLEVLNIKNLVLPKKGLFLLRGDNGEGKTTLLNITPIIEKIDENSAFFCGATVADKVTGKAAAMLLVKYGVTELHTGVISRNALDFLAYRNG